MYKKIYLEITNICNLDCSFCIKNCRSSKYMSEEEFNIVLGKIKPYTKYLYFHILGEPLMHPRINEYIDKASNDFFINITTNGYMIDKIRDNKNIRQINISLHSYDEKYKVKIEEYMNNIFKSIDVLKENTFISLRFWLENKYTADIIRLINNHYNTNITYKDIKNNTTLCKHIFLSVNDEFIWPDLDNNYYNESGKCYALKDHIGILVDGTVVPCCLDSKGVINLGNIYKDDISSIVESNRYQNIFKSFQNNNKCEELCRHCNFCDSKEV